MTKLSRATPPPSLFVSLSLYVPVSISASASSSASGFLSLALCISLSFSTVNRTREGRFPCTVSNDHPTRQATPHGSIPRAATCYFVTPWRRHTHTRARARTHRQTYRQTDRHTNRETDRQTHTHPRSYTRIHIYIYNSPCALISSNKYHHKTKTKYRKRSHEAMVYRHSFPTELLI